MEAVFGPQTSREASVSEFSVLAYDFGSQTGCPVLKILV